MSDLLTRIASHCARTATAPTRFGRNAVNDPRLVGDLRNGREPGARLVARVEAYLQQETTR